MATKGCRPRWCAGRADATCEVGRFVRQRAGGAGRASVPCSGASPCRQLRGSLRPFWCARAGLCRRGLWRRAIRRCFTGLRRPGFNCFDDAADGGPRDRVVPRQGADRLPPCRRSMIALRSCGVTLAGLPSVTPSLLARSRPAWVRSINRSFSISATAASIWTTSLPAGDVGSICPSWKTMTEILRRASSLPAFPDERILQRQFMVTAVAVSGQRVINALGRLQGLPECIALATDLAAGRFAGGLAQRTGLLGKAIGRGRLARIAAVLVDLRFERLQARQPRQNEDVLLFVRQSGQIGRGGLPACTSH